MKRMILCVRVAVVMAALLILVPATSDAATVKGTVVDVAGTPITAANLLINGMSVPVDESGDFAAAVDSQDIYQLRLSAPGHFSFIQTYSRADLQMSADEGVIDVPPIALVARADERRLLVFAGDTMMGRRFVEPRDGEPALIHSDSVKEDMQAILQHAKPYLELADFASVNLETQLAAETPTKRLPKSVTFFTHPEITNALRWAGVDYVALGNNHTFDYMDEGLEQTLAAATQAGLAFSGAGRESAAARKAYVADISGQRADLLSYVGWSGTFEPSQAAEADKGGAALGTAESIGSDLERVPGESLGIVQYHSGLEYKSEPPLFEETQLKLAIDRGADLAIGHHSHVLQGFEVYRDKLVAFSLGNFVFDQYLPSTHAGMLLFAWYDGDEFYRAEVVPMHNNGYVPTPATGIMRYDILQRLSRLSQGDDTCVDRSGGHLVVLPCKNSNARRATQQLEQGKGTEGGDIVHLKTLGAAPIAAIESVASTGPYRLGLDLLRRGDFEYVGLFDTEDRTWIEHPQVTIVREESSKMRLSLAQGDKIRTGMKVFTRVFSRSNPATVVATVKSSGCARLEASLQRRPDGEGFEDALISGPVLPIGEVRLSEGTSAIALEFQLPRTSTRSIRLLLDISHCDQSGEQTIVDIDDLAIIEWQTPWISPPALVPDADTTQATHIQFLP